jgi:hypothetical protein
MGWATEKALKDFLDDYINKNIISEVILQILAYV